ncbi:MAG: hypothetical protein GEEBNDBF_00262 [bacterium]|nr:hypothetical protein [bacterium]
MGGVKLVDNQLTTFRIESRHPQWRLWGMILVWLLLVMFGVERYLHWYTLTQVIPEYTEVDEFGVVHQSTDFTCVPAAFTTLLRQQGVEAEQRSVTAALGTTVFGTYPWMIPRVGRQFGYQVTQEKLDFAALCATEDPLLLHNHFTEGFHVSYVPPGRLSPDLARRLFGGKSGPFLPVMDPVDGLVLMDEAGFVDYFDSGGKKSVYRFRSTGQAPRPLNIDAVLLSGRIPLIKVEGWELHQ